MRLHRKGVLWFYISIFIVVSALNFGQTTPHRFNTTCYYIDNLYTFYNVSLNFGGFQIWMTKKFFRRFRKIAKTTVIFVMSVRLSACNNSVPTGWMLMKFDIWGFVENLSRKFQFFYSEARITSTLREALCTTIISCWIPLRIIFQVRKGN